LPVARPVGIIANPASGKDIRRIVARASTFDNQEKRNIVRRAIAGAIAAGTEQFYYLPDGYGLVSEAAEESAGSATFTAVDSPETGSALDTVRAARQLKDLGCGAVITLGGDGTNRAVAQGWLEVPVVAISTGTNNVFPRMVEATVAGAAAGAVASGRITLEEASDVAKVVHAEVEGEKDDLALIDAVFLADIFVGSRAIWDGSRLRLAVLTRAEPAAVGISSLGGLIAPTSGKKEHGLLLRFGGENTVIAPIAPGLYQEVAVDEVRRLPFDERVEVAGQGVLAFDGERERTLKEGQRAQLRVVRDGPRVIDIERVMALAACRGLFRSAALEVRDGD
jgi:predicted polyphosphate/ATP-dependent NAD kinase